MIKNWILSNKSDLKTNVPKEIDLGRFSIWADKGVVKKYSNGVFILVNGYFVPRNTITTQFKEKQEDLVLSMYKQYGIDFPKYGKGCYNIVIIDKEEFYIISDRFGQIKHFHAIDKKSFIFSNSMLQIKNNLSTDYDYYSMALHTLYCHFIDGRTIYKNIFYNSVASIYFFKNNLVKEYQYDTLDRIYNLSKKDINIKDIASVLNDVILDLRQRYDISNTSLSLTGGMDTRNLLALLLKQEVRPHLYTYGNPKSEDSMRAKNISDGLDLQHELYDIKLSSKKFQEYSRKIMCISHGLSSIHRVHRLLSVEQESEYAKTMFLGTLGGEFVKGAHFNDYILSKFIKQYWNSTEKIELIKETLENKFFNTKLIDLNELNSIIQKQPFNQYKEESRNVFHALCYITARTHDAQDINLYYHSMDVVFTPFLDIDYLEILFSSYYTFEHKDKIENKFRRRLSNPVYSSNFIQFIYPELGEYLYAGQYSPNEMLLSPYLAMIKKIIRSKLGKKYPNNFPLSQWMIDFVNDSFVNDLGAEVAEIFDIGKLKKSFIESDHELIEAYWLKYTNIIQLQYLFDYCM